MMKKLLIWLLTAAVTVGLFPMAAITAFAEELDTAYTLSDAYISVSVSKANGGFTVRTVEGDRLKKSDNNKELLYHDGAYDTSFVSVRVGEKDYLFGGKYEGSSDVAVTQSSSEITAVWSVDQVTFTQRISLENTSSNQSGMVSISLTAKNESGMAVPVRARILYDTALGSQDYGYYQYTDSGQKAVTVTQEQTLNSVPDQIYATNDRYNPTVGAYSVSTGTVKPTKVAFGHWSHLASTLFDFTPLSTLDFTNTRSEYMTADSAYALYFDLGTIASCGEASLTTYYGVFSNHATPASNSVAVNLTAPVRLTLNEGKTDFVEQVSKGQADFSVTVDFSNVAVDGAQDLKKYALVVRSSGNLRSLDDDGKIASTQDFTSSDPFKIIYNDVLKVGASRSKTLYFKAKTVSEASYERITVGVYALTEDGQLSETNKLGERIAYVLLPGTDNDVPQVNFAAMTPKIIYTEGTRHLFVTVTNDNLLDNTGNWNLYACSEDDTTTVQIPHANITIADGVMDVALTDDIRLSEGGWYLQLEWANATAAPDGKTLKQTAPELHFTVSSDKKYKNDAYSVLAVVEKFTNKQYVHTLVAYQDEAEFEAYRSKHTHMYGEEEGQEEVLLFFKGEFTEKENDGSNPNRVSYVATSTKTMVNGEYQVDNPIVINGCMDFEGGTMKVYMDSTGAIYTEFDGELYTNTERTAIWSGEALLTPIESGVNYTLTPYNENGERKWYSTDYKKLSAEWSQTGNFGNRQNVSRGTAIMLVWPSTLGAIGQTISGMIFKMAYAQMGIMYDTEDQTNEIDQDIGYVLSFTASLDLSFATGKVDESKADPPTVWSELKATMAMYDYNQSFSKYIYKAGKNQSALFPSDINEDGGEDNHKGITASVMVQDVLFGCGEGFVGVNFEVGVSIENYVSALPEIEGTIAVNTVNNWSYGIEGKIDLEAFAVEAKVKFASSDGIPIPDELYVFVSGFEPGLNIDGLGVIWITGGGGGISNIYDSIFMTQAVPPLKLTLSVSFDLLKVLSCKKASLSLGLTGVSLQAEEITVKNVDSLRAIEKMGLSFEWYPGIDLRASIAVNLFEGIISGGGYIVLISPDYKDVFFEMFARATLSVPKSIPVVGGMMIAGVDLGLNTEKVWGAIDVLSITLGVTYYWGESSVDFGSGDKNSPTFPELLGYDDIPVYYDEENDQTLYARFGTNTQVMASSLDDNGGVELMGSSGTELICNSPVDKNNYTVTLGSCTAGDKAIVQITYKADSLANAKEKAKAITVKDSDSNPYSLVCYEQQTDADGNLVSSNRQTANANLSYDETTKKATYAFTVTEQSGYGKDWTLTTPAGSDVILYNVDAVPKVGTVSGTVSGSNITLKWTGSELSGLDQISFYLCKSNDAASTDPGYAIDVLDSSNSSSKITTGSAELTIPANVPSGSYYIRAVYSKADEVNGVVFSGSQVTVTNNNTPGKVGFTAKAAGNLQYELTINEGTNTDGYLVTVYDAAGKATDFENVSYKKAKSGKTVINVGGSYKSVTKDENGDYVALGLTGGESYTIGVTPYKTVTTKIGGVAGKTAIYGAEVKSEGIELPVMSKPTVTFSADKTAKTRTETLNAVAGKKEYTRDVYTTNALTVTATVSEEVTGTWKLDDAEANKDTGKTGTFAGTKSIPIALTGLTEGEHTITVEGAAADGDSFYATYTFTVDTLPPQLLISSPVNGEFVGIDSYTDSGKSITEINGYTVIHGNTDEGAIVTVTCDGKTIYNSALPETYEEEQKLSDGKVIYSSRLNTSTGRFWIGFYIPDFNSASEHTLTIKATDDVGNTTDTHTVTVSHGGLAKLESLEVSVDGSTYNEGNIPVLTTGLENAELTLVGVTTDTSGNTPKQVKFNLTGCNVSWDINTVEGTASVDDGRLTAGTGSQGIITGRLAVADGAYRTATLCFGAPTDNTVSVSTTIGGSVTGGGQYAPGATVTLKATPDSGYRFTGWAIAGVSVSGTSSETVTFTMPATGNVTAEALFEAVGDSSGVGVSGISVSDDSVSANAGEVVRVKLPAGKDESDYLPCYTDSSGEFVFVPVSTVIDGYVVFIAPENATYRFASNPVGFDDTVGHWAEEDIDFCAERRIFKGVGDRLFDPNGSMTRAMFATVLYRIAGSPAVSGTGGFSDVAAGQWYTDAILWGQNTDIIKGYDDGRFGTNDLVTREQMCTLLVRYLNWAGYELPTVAESQAFSDQAQIASWAAESVSFCQTHGLINGRTGNLFASKDSATRAENSAVFHRLILSILSSVK